MTARPPYWMLAPTLCASLSAAMPPSSASADCGDAHPAGTLDPTCEDDVGHSICVQEPRELRTTRSGEPRLGPPGLRGVPEWPSTSDTVPDDGDDPPASGTDRGEISDPRWSVAPPRNLWPNSPFAVLSSDNAVFRVVADDKDNPQELSVSVQLRSATGDPEAEDRMYFGITDGGSRAFGVKVPLLVRDGGGDPLTGSHLQLVDGAIEVFTFNGTSWNSSIGRPTWLKEVAVWNDESKTGINGAAWAMQLKLNLSTIGIQGTESAKVAVGVIAEVDGAGEQEYFSPNRNRCEGGTCTDGTAGGSTGANPFVADPDQWTPLGQFDDNCDGINITRHDIATDVTCDNRSNCVSVVAGETTTFSATPTVGADDMDEPVVDIDGPGRVTARFRMSNWGSTGTPASWVELGEVTNGGSGPNPDYADFTTNPFEIACTSTGNDGTFGDVCDNSIRIVSEDHPTDERFHQCLLVELEATPLGQDDGIQFGQSLDYINTRFEEASLIDVAAEINVQGIPDPDPSDPYVDVYLQVVKTNMPDAGADPIEMDVPALEALRAQVDPAFRETVGGCARAVDQCVQIFDGDEPVELDGVALGFCGTPCGGLDGDSCSGGREAATLNGECFCFPGAAEAQQCDPETLVPPAGGGLNPLKRALDDGQVLTAEYPTFEVFPFYDSGSQRTGDTGAARKQLVAMPSFVVHAWHETDPARGGTPFYGWLTSLIDEATGSPLPEVGDNVFLMRVNKSTGIGKVQLLISAEEQAHYAPMGEIAGAATTLGFGLGNVEVVGVTDGTSNLDLSSTEITVNELLSENGSELVTNFSGPQTLVQLPGATPFAATYAYPSIPGMLVEVVTLPLVGHVVTIVVAGASVRHPSQCNFFGFGTTQLRTEFRMDDGINSPITVRGDDQWSCAPFEIFNY